MTFKSLFTFKANTIVYVGYSVGKVIGGEIGAAAEATYNIYNMVDTVVTVVDVIHFGFKTHKWYQIGKAVWELYKAASNDANV